MQSAERAIALARRLVAAGIDPGPVLQHGLAGAMHVVSDIGDAASWPAIVDRAYLGAGAILDLKKDPWHFLSPGHFIAARVAGDDPAAFGEILDGLRDLHLDLSRADIDADRIFMGLRNLVLGLSPRERTVLSTTIASLRGFAPALRARSIDPVAAASGGLGTAAALMQETGAGWIIDDAAAFGRRLAEAGVDPAGAMQHAFPAIVRAAGTDREGARVLLDALVEAMAMVRSQGGLAPAVPLDEVIAQAAAASGEEAGAIAREAIALVRRCASEGRDASALAARVLPLFTGSLGPARPALGEALASFVRRQPAASPVGEALEILDRLKQNAVGFVAIRNEGIDTTTPAGRLMLHLVAAFAEFERELIRERVQAGVARVKATGKTKSGKPIGRPRRDVDPGRVAHLRAEGRSWREIAMSVGVPVRTARRALLRLENSSSRTRLLE